MRTPTSGFTLLELLLGVAIGSTLVIAVAEIAQVFSQQVSYVREATDTDLEDALTEITDASRYAWLVVRDSATRLEVEDASGRETAFFLEDGAVKVTRPSGATGVLVDEVASMTVEVETTQRLRDATPQEVYGTWWQHAPVGTETVLELEEGDAVAFGFTASSIAPDWTEVVTGVSEELESATLETVTLPLAFMDRSPMEFCHLHATEPHNPVHKNGGGVISAELYEARAPGDARPIGSPLATFPIAPGSLTPVPYSWVDITTGDAVIPPEVVFPPGGVAWGWWEENPQVQLVTGMPTSYAAVDVSGLGAMIEPGRAYTLVLRVIDNDDTSRVYVPAVDVAPTGTAAVALQEGATNPFQPRTWSLPLTLNGLRRYTQTEEHQPVSRVTVTIVLDDGTSLTASTGVLSQLAAEDPWLGVAPGDAPTLTLAGI